MNRIVNQHKTVQFGWEESFLKDLAKRYDASIAIVDATPLSIKFTIRHGENAGFLDTNPVIKNVTGYKTTREGHCLIITKDQEPVSEDEKSAADTVEDKSSTPPADEAKDKKTSQKAGRSKKAQAKKTEEEATGPETT